MKNGEEDMTVQKTTHNNEPKEVSNAVEEIVNRVLRKHGLEAKINNWTWNGKQTTLFFKLNNSNYFIITFDEVGDSIHVKGLPVEIGKLVRIALRSSYLFYSRKR